MCTLEILYSQSSVSVFHLKRTEETKSNFELIFTAQFTSSICSSKSEKRSTLTLPGLRRIQEYSNLIFLKDKLITLMETEQWKIWTCEPKRLPWMHLFIHVAPCPERSFRKEKTDLEDKNKCIYLATNWIYANTCWTPCGAILTDVSWNLSKDLFQLQTCCLWDWSWWTLSRSVPGNLSAPEPRRKN